MERLDSDRQFINPEGAARQLYQKWRERLVVPLLIGILLFGAVALIPAVNASDSAVVDAALIGVYLLIGLVTVVQFPYTVRMSVFLLGIYAVGIVELITHSILGDSLFFFLALIVFATIMISPKTGILAVLLELVTFVLFGWLIQNELFIPFNPNASPAQIADWVSASAAIVMFGSVVILAFQRLEIEFVGAQKQIDATLNTLTVERTNLEKSVQDRTYQLRKINEIGRVVTSILDPDELFPQASRLIEEDFKCYYTAFYLWDGLNQWAELRYASGDAGKVLKENKHRLDVNGKSAIALALQSKTGQIIQDSNPIRFDNPLLPYTRSQLALPLIVGDVVLGVLDMHSSKDNAFQPQDVDAYQNMANGIAIMLENSRLFQEAQQSLSEMKSTQQQYLQNVWRSLTSEQDIKYEIGEKDTDSRSTLEIPLSVRDQIIGQIQLENSEEWSNEQKNLIEAIVDQAALALENARLVEESQSSATQERLANDIISKIWASSNMDNILQVTVRELGRNLEATEVEIEVSMEGNEDE